MGNNVAGILLLAGAGGAVSLGLSLEDFVLIGVGWGLAALIIMSIILLGVSWLPISKGAHRARQAQEAEFDVGQAFRMTASPRPWAFLWCEARVEEPEKGTLHWITGRFVEEGLAMSAKRCGEVSDARLIYVITDPLGLFCLRVETARFRLKVNPRRVWLPHDVLPSPRHENNNGARASVPHRGDPFDIRACEPASAQRVLWSLWSRTGEYYTRDPEVEDAQGALHVSLLVTDAENEQAAAEVARWLVEEGRAALSVCGFDHHPTSDPERGRELIRRAGDLTAVDAGLTSNPLDDVIITGPTTFFRFGERLACLVGPMIVVAVRPHEKALPHRGSTRAVRLILVP